MLHGLGMRGQHSVLPISKLVMQVLQLSTGALDDDGKERKTYGGYIQGTFDFGQGTSVGYSYGGNYMRMTGSDMNNLGTTTGQYNALWYDLAQCN